MLESQKTVASMLAQMKAAVFARNFDHYELLSDELAIFAKASLLPSEPVNWQKYGVSRSERMICELLHRNMDRLITKDGIMDMLYFDRPDPPSREIINIFVFKIRRKLASSPFEIECRMGQGWIMHKADAAKPT